MSCLRLSIRDVRGICQHPVIMGDIELFQFLPMK